MLRLLMISLIVSGCSTTPTTTKFDPDFTLIEIVPGKKSACMPQEKVKELRRILIQCGERYD